MRFGEAGILRLSGEWTCGDIRAPGKHTCRKYLLGERIQLTSHKAPHLLPSPKSFWPQFLIPKYRRHLDSELQAFVLGAPG